MTRIYIGMVLMASLLAPTPRWQWNRPRAAPGR